MESSFFEKIPCILKNNSFVGDMGNLGGAYLNFEGKCRCGLFPFEHPAEPYQLPASVPPSTAPAPAARPGDMNNVFGICVLEVKNIGTRSAPNKETNILPCGTAFSISPSLVLTAFHNLASRKRMCLVKSLTISSESLKVLRSDVIYLKASPIYKNKDDDWAILEREVGAFDTFAEICGNDGELPPENSDIAIKHFPVGLIDLSSVTHLRVVSSNERLICFSPRLSPSDEPSAAKKRKLIVGPLQFTITPAGAEGAENNPSEIVEKVADVAFASNGLSRGSCGAPYFTLNGKVFAFHVESIDDGYLHL
eukprot:gene24373-32818_t